MTKTYIKTEIREYRFTAGEVQKILLRYLQDEKTVFMGSFGPAFATEENGDVIITTTDSVERTNK